MDFRISVRRAPPSFAEKNHFMPKLARRLSGSQKILLRIAVGEKVEQSETEFHPSMQPDYPPARQRQFRLLVKYDSLYVL